MAVVIVPFTSKRYDTPEEISTFLRPHGIEYERWAVEGRIGADATNAEILTAYKPEIDALKQRGGYATADVINVTAETPGLDQMLEKFNKEHTHSEDEIRFIVKGRGVFHIHPKNAPVFSIQTDAGDLINVPAETQHWFDLCSERSIRAIRLFKDVTGWTPSYIPEGVHYRFSPVCWGPELLPNLAAQRKLTVAKS